MGVAYIIGTCDTKEAELLYAKKEAERAGARARLVNVSTRGGSAKADVSAPRGLRGIIPRAKAAVLGLSGPGRRRGAPWQKRCSRFMMSRKDLGRRAWAWRIRQYGYRDHGHAGACRLAFPS